MKHPLLIILSNLLGITLGVISLEQIDLICKIGVSIAAIASFIVAIILKIKRYRRDKFSSYYKHN